MHPSCPYDPFKEARDERGVLPARFGVENIPMILGYKDVRLAAKDYQTFSSDTPFRVPIPSEENDRSVRQIPVETDPPEHKEYRQIVEPFFNRPRQPEYAERIAGLIHELLDKAAGKDSAEIVREFSLPLQSRALTYLLGIPESEAELFISWGIHVFRHTDDGKSNGQVLEDYLNAQIDRAMQDPGDDFFSMLTQAEFQGRKLTRDEILGYSNLVFAGGRDTVIHTVSSIIGHIAKHPEILHRLRADDKLITTATEEFVRFVSPLTHLGRTCPVDTEVNGEAVKAGERVSLCWASANFDSTVFEAPEELRIDRKPNPHIGFGSGVHNCLGANHARLIIRTLLQILSEKFSAITIIDAKENLETEQDYERVLGYEVLRAKMVSL
jgi:cytochrome P450